MRAFLSSAFKSFIKEEALSLGFDDIGIAKADDYTPFANEFLNAKNEGRLGPLDYLYNLAEIRTNIREQMPDVKSVLIVVKNYYTGDHPPNSEHSPKIARYAWGQDYHQWFKKRLKQLANTLLKDRPDHFARPFNDTGPFLERAWAFKAGLGFIGKSTMFIHRGFGTWTLLGGIATSVDLEPDPAYQGPDCGSCTRCMDSCPTSAIVKPHQLDANKCIATWTIERSLDPRALSSSPRNHTWAFGCDICQEVCPWNKFQVKTYEPRFIPVPGRVIFSEMTLKQDLRGSALNRTKRAGLRANYLRIRNTLKEKNIKFN